MRILITGASGLLGHDLVDCFQEDEILAPRSHELNILEPNQVCNFIAGHKLDWIIHCAAYTDVDASEAHQDLAFAVNRDATTSLSRAAADTGSRLLYISTDYVFDGLSNRPYEPHDSVNPINIYGVSKAAGESAVRNHASQWLIVRSSWLFGGARVCFPEKILLAAASQPLVKVVNDQIGSPTYTRDLADAIRRLVRKEARGTLHVTNSEHCSWLEFAREILRKAGRQTPVLPISSIDSQRAAKRPPYSVLSPLALAAHGIRLRTWSDALDAYLDELRRMGKLR